MKKFISALLVVVMLFGFVPFSNTAKTTLGTTEASAKETVDGSYNAVTNYIRQKGRNGSYHCGDFEVEIKGYRSNYGSYIFLAYNSTSKRIMIGIEDEDSRFYTTTGVDIPKEDGPCECAFYIADWYDDVLVRGEFDSKVYGTANFEYTLFVNLGSIKPDENEAKAELNAVTKESLNILNDYLMKNLGFGLANFGFTVFGDPIPLKETKVQTVNMGNFSIKYKEATISAPEIISDGYDYTVKFESSNPKVISINDDGEIQTLHKGSSVITCTVTDSFGNVTTQSSEVKVTLSFGQWLIYIFLFGFLWY